MLHVFMLYMSMRGRYTFMNMERYGSYSEKRYRDQFSEHFCFLNFNKELVKEKSSAHLIIAFDPSFIPKSGNTTEHCGWFWSDSSGKSMKGLEIGVLAATDVDANTA